jgi:hypothetical protein
MASLVQCICGNPMTRRTQFLRLVIVAMGFAISLAQAELPPPVYIKWQTDAPELLDLQITKVDTAPAGEMMDVTLTAKVTAVTRSASGLTVGQVIRIRYQSRPPDVIVLGASTPPVFRVGDHTPAYLKPGGTDFAPAAGGMSFRPFDPRPNATEQFTLKVEKVRDTPTPNDPQHLSVTATVLADTVSMSDVRIADTIVIDYKLDPYHPPRLQPGQTVPAYLNRFVNPERHFYCAAGVLSFTPLAAPATAPATAP